MLLKKKYCLCCGIFEIFLTHFLLYLFVIPLPVFFFYTLILVIYLMYYVKYIWLYTTVILCDVFLIRNKVSIVSPWMAQLQSFRSSHPELFLGKGVLKICSKFTGEHSCRYAISIKLLTTLLKSHLDMGVLL